MLFIVAEAVGSQGRKADKLGFGEAVGIGLAQAAALVPGVSRSGATITLGLFLGLRREEAARFSFLMSVPIIAGAGGLAARPTVLGTAWDAHEWLLFLAGLRHLGGRGVPGDKVPARLPDPPQPARLRLLPLRPRRRRGLRDRCSRRGVSWTRAAPYWFGSTSLTAWAIVWYFDRIMHHAVEALRRFTGEGRPVPDARPRSS